MRPTNRAFPNSEFDIASFLIEIVTPFVDMLFACRVTGFEHSNLTKRFSTLTLLILGEGVIGFALTLQESTYTCFVATALTPSCWRYWVRRRWCACNFHDWFHHLFPLGVLFLHFPWGCNVQCLACVRMGNVILFPFSQLGLLPFPFPCCSRSCIAKCQLAHALCKYI